MKLRSKSLWLGLVGLVFSAVLAAAEDWTQFRGPTAQGHSATTGLPRHWSEDEHVQWKTELPGEGWSSPVSANGKIWMTTALEDGKSLHALCVDFATGKILIDTEVFHTETAEAKHQRNSYASPSPIIDGDRVYVHFGSAGTACISGKDGSRVWVNNDLKVDFQNGAGASPVLFKDKLLVTCDGMDFQYEVALDKLSGKVLWKTQRSAMTKLAMKPVDMRKAYGTPLVIESADGMAVSLSTGAERLYAYDPQTGKELWYVDYPGFSNVPVPVSDGKMVYVATGFGKPEMWAIRLGGKGDVTGTHVAWRQSSGAPDQSSPVLVGERLYMVNNGGIATCLNAGTGAVVWKERIGSDFAASLLYADGLIYFFDCGGRSRLVEPGDTFKEVAKNGLADGFMASPAVVGKSLVLRTKTSLYRIE